MNSLLFTYMCIYTVLPVMIRESCFFFYNLINFLNKKLKIKEKVDFFTDYDRYFYLLQFDNKIIFKKTKIEFMGYKKKGNKIF